MPSLNHTHTYIRVKQSKTDKRVIFRCAHPDCYHFLEKRFLIGRRCLCNICHSNEFILTREDLLRSKPICPECSNTKEAKARRELKKLVVEEVIEPMIGELK